MTTPHDANSTRHDNSDSSPEWTISARVRIAVTVACIILGAFIFGFALFAANVMRDHPASEETADGIIVLTGGDFRIPEAGRLLQDKRAGRLLISGVNAVTTRDDLLKLSGIDRDLFDCCVDVGYAAQDTLGNAEEARTWANDRKMKRLIVVTSNYHMPRSLAELALALPDAELIPDAVVPRKFRTGAWWAHPGAARLLLSEYVKFLPVAARLTAMRYLTPRAPPATTANALAAPRS